MLNLWTRRRFLRMAGQGALAAALPGWLPAQNANTVTISLLHTTDLHGHILPTTDYFGHGDLGGLARCATQIGAWRRENPNSLLLDIGDVYQGTQVSLDSRGALMIRCLNALKYDAWVIGNHDFDWGPEPLRSALNASAMTVLSGNSLVEGRPPTRGAIGTARDLQRLRPYLIKEVAGFRIAIIGLTTPALTSWLPPEYLRDYEVLEPIESLRTLLREVEALRPDAIVVAGHMGLTRRDDYPNQVGAVTAQFPQLAVYLGGHTHKNYAGEMINGVLYTQADHYGIHAGRVDLTFDRASRKLVQRTAITVPMDNRISADPIILALAAHDLGVAEQELARPVGELTESFSALAAPGTPGDQERLIGSAIKAALQSANAAPDVVMHGLFENRNALAAGPVTLADIWTLLPYENQLVTVELTTAELLSVANELANAREPRLLMGIRAPGTRAGGRTTITELRDANGVPLSASRTYRLALNSYDSQSGGGRYPRLGQLVADGAHRRVLHPLGVRETLVSFFTLRGKVGRSSLLV